MEIWQIIVLSYLGALVAWLIINALFLLVSMIVKHKVFAILEIITSIMAFLFGIATGIGDIVLIVWLFQNNQIVWAVLAIFFGIGVVTIAGQILSAPFIWITAGFSAWYDETED